MTKISINDDIGTSAQKQFAVDFNVAFAKGDMGYVLDCFSDDITWDVINHEPVQGKDNVKTMLSEMDEVASELVIENIVQDGATCVVMGKLIYGDNAIAFSDLYVFTTDAKDTKIRRLKGYAVELKPIKPTFK